MPSKTEIQNLANSRLEEAELLLKNKHPEAAFYLAGFSIELAFKAVICKKLDISFEELAEIKSFKIHDLGSLLLFSGLRNRHKLSIKNDKFKEYWSSVIV